MITTSTNNNLFNKKCFTRTICKKEKEHYQKASLNKCFELLQQRQQNISLQDEPPL